MHACSIKVDALHLYGFLSPEPRSWWHRVLTLSYCFVARSPFGFPADMRGIRDHAAQRWSIAVMSAVDAAEDPRTLQKWAHAAGTSVGALRVWCRAAHTSPRASLYFARMLRAVLISRKQPWDPFNLLDIVDERTLRALLRRCGLTQDQDPTLDAFLAEQTLVSDSRNLEAILEALNSRGLR